MTPLVVEVMKDPNPKNALTFKIAELVGGMVNVEDVDTVAPVVELGLSSMHAVDLTTQLGELVGLELSPTLIYEAVTIQGMAAKILQVTAQWHRRESMYSVYLNQ